MTIHWIAGLIFYIKMTWYFPKLCKPFDWYINVKIDLSKYATNSYLKNVTGSGTSKLAAKPDLVGLKKNEVDNLNIDK